MRDGIDGAHKIRVSRRISADERGLLIAEDLDSGSTHKDRQAPHPYRGELIVKHAVIWIDQKEARIIEVDADKLAQSTVNRSYSVAMVTKAKKSQGSRRARARTHGDL